MLLTVAFGVPATKVAPVVPVAVPPVYLMVFASALFERR